MKLLQKQLNNFLASRRMVFMNILSAKFIKGVVAEDEILENGILQLAFIGRSNVGKSSVINSLTGQKGLAKTSSFPGHTQEINIFLVSVSGGSKFYFVDLPGYGFAKASKQVQELLQQRIYWYLLGSLYEQKKVVLIVDAVVGVTGTDMKMLYSLKESGKNIVVVANKVDKLKKSEYKKQIAQIQQAIGKQELVEYSAEKKIGVSLLVNKILGK